jgi:CheY-like chemotaxis protein
MSEKPLPVSPSPAGVLIVDDNKILLSLLTITLEQEGYRVWRAVSGRDAVELFRGDSDNIHVALLDVGLPGGMTGHEVSKALRKLQPTVKVIFMSGMERIESGAKEEKAVEPFFYKPFSPIDLLKAIKCLLTSQPGSSRG